ncbi:MAG: hypothetical protein ABEJ70_06395 [Halobacteriaceae archaeon]
MASTTRRADSGVTVDTASLTGLHWLAIALAAVTGAVHLYLYLLEDWLPFLLAGLGFFGAIVLLIVLPRYRRSLYPVGVLYVLAQIVGYVLLPLGPAWLGYLDKAVQVLLVLVLVQLYRTS